MRPWIIYTLNVLYSERIITMWPNDTPRPKGFSYTINVDNLKQAMVNIHLNHLHSIQLDMIDEAVLKSDMTESKELLKHIMEKK